MLSGNSKSQVSSLVTILSLCKNCHFLKLQSVWPKEHILLLHLVHQIGCCCCCCSLQELAVLPFEGNVYSGF